MIPRTKIDDPDNTVVQGTHQHGHQNAPCNFPVSSSNFNVATEVYYKRTDGFDIVNYKQRKARGDLLPHTPFEQVEYTRSVSPGTLTVIWKSSGCKKQVSTNWTGLAGLEHFDPKASDISSELEISVPDGQRFVQSAASRIYTKGHDTLTFVSELRKVADMFRGVISKILRLIAGKSPGDIASLWLEGRYGWRTLIYDLQDLDEALRNFDVSRKRYSERAGLSYTEIVNDSGTYDTTYTDYQNTRVTTYTVGVRGSVTADISPPQFRFNPIATSWELIPFSFVVDWVLSIGRSIEAASFLALQQAYVSSSGFHIQASRNDTLTGIDTAGTTVSISGGSRTEVLNWTTRTPTSVGIVPHLQLNVNLLKGLDLVALAKQLIK